MSEKPEMNDWLDDLIASDTDGLLDQPVKPVKVTSGDRLEKGFLEIVEFYKDNGREPAADTLVIAERKLGARLEGFRLFKERAEAVAHLDEYGLLTPETEEFQDLDSLLESAAFGELAGVDAGSIFDLSGLPAIPQSKPESVAELRKKAKDFEKYQHLFVEKHADIANGLYALEPFKGLPTIKKGEFFVLSGVMLFIAEVHETELVETNGGRPKERLRVIFENGTESQMYRQSLAGRLGEREDSRHLVPKHIELPDVGSLERLAGHIYVLKSLSDDPVVKGIPNLYKIGYCTTSVEKRIANAENSPTYLMAPVEIVADYAVYDININALEHLIHQVFASVRLDLQQVNLKGKQVAVTEWFVVPLQVIDQAMDLVIDGEIFNYRYDKSVQALLKIKD